MNRRLRRALEAQRRGDALVRRIGPEDKDAMIAYVNHPDRLALIEGLKHALTAWKAAHPGAVLRWHYAGRALVFGSSLGDARAVSDFLAASPDAIEAIKFADEQTGRAATLLLAECALVGLGWMTREGRDAGELN